MNRNKKLIDVVRIHERQTTTTSKIVGLNPKCRYINIVMSSVDDVTINSQIIRPMSTRTIRFASFLSGLKVFLFLFLVRHLMLEFLYAAHLKAFYFSYYNLLGIIVFILVAFAAYFLKRRALRKRSVKYRSGGVFEYEFF